MSETRGEGVVNLVNDLIDRAIAARASDVHFEPTDDGLRVRFRVDAALRDVERLPAGIAPNVVARLKVMAGLLTYRTDVPQEGAIARSRSRFPCDIRTATFPTVRGERVVLRIMAHAHRFLTLDDLGHDPELVARLRTLLAHPSGLLAICGPAGSGKTTTLYALLAHVLAARPDVSVLSVEDPVEIRLDGVTQVQIEPDRGLTYPVALRSILRQDPQVLMIGEVRDAETARIVVEAALTGHLLLTTLHSGTPAEAIIRLREMGLAAYQLTSTLRGVLAQRLVRTVCAECGPASPQSDCARCLGTGFAGRTAIGQLVEMSSDLRQALLAESDAAALSDSAVSGKNLRADADRLIQSGSTTADEVRSVLGD